MEEADKFRPVSFEPKSYAIKRRKKDKRFAAAYDALEDEFSALAALLKARHDAGLTQADIARRMGVSQPVIARIEGGLGKKSHSPSLNTLRRYADACGMKLVFQLVDNG